MPSGVVLALVTTLPFLLAYERQSKDLRFTGSIFAVEDTSAQVVWRQAVLRLLDRDHHEDRGPKL